jgi:hypothetical protein
VTLADDSFPVPDWIDSPLIVAEWRELRGADALALLGRIERSGAAPHLAHMGDYDVERMRAARLDCYRDTLLIELQAVLHPDGERGIATFLYAPGGFIPLAGSSTSFHRLNATGALAVDTEARAMQYCRLFCAGTHGERGAFEFVDGPQSLRLRADATLDDAAQTACTRGHAVEPQAEGEWKIAATLQYDGTLFASHFLIHLSGAIEMMDDEPLIETLPVRPIAQTGPFRLFRNEASQ